MPATAVHAQARRLPYLFVAALVLGFAVRVWLSTLGMNYDMRSWFITAAVMDADREIYFGDGRYNYGPVWAYLLHALAHFTPLVTGRPYGIETFHWVVAGFLSVVDAAIACILRAWFGTVAALVFFLCPLTILITGFHSQFDNLAVLLGLLAWMILRDPARRSNGAWLAVSAMLVGLSLSTKHILVFFPVWILLWPPCGPLLRRVGFCAVSYAVFALSFLPWAIHAEARHFIIANVVNYNSVSRFALLPRVLRLFPPIPGLSQLLQSVPAISGTRLVWLACMTGVGKIVISRQRDEPHAEVYPMYLASMVALAPAAANQSLVVPMVAIAIYWRNPLSWVYLVLASVYVFLSASNVGGLPAFHGLNVAMVESGFRPYHVLACLLVFLATMLWGPGVWPVIRRWRRVS